MTLDTDDTTHRTTTSPAASPALIPWLPRGLSMAIAFMLLVTMSEIAFFMPVNLYGPMGADLGLAPSAVSWAILASAIASAVSTPLIARLGDILGHRRVLVGTLVLVVIGWFVSAAALTAPLLLAGRFLTGFGNATAALTLAIVARHLTQPDQRKAIAINIAGQATATSVGFILSGALLTLGFSWRIAFAAGGTLLLACFVAVLLLVPKVDQPRTRVPLRDYDIPAIGLLGVGLAALTIALNQVLVWGSGSPEFLFTLALGVVCIAAWIGWEFRAPNPLVDLRIAFSRKLWPAFTQFLFSTLATLTLFSLVLTFMMTPAETGYGFGLSPVMAACVMIPSSLFGWLAARLTPSLLGRVTARTGILLPGAGIFLTYVFFYFFHGSIVEFVIVTALFGYFVHALVIASTSLIAAEAPKDRAAATTGLYIVFASIGQALGAALYGLALTAYADPATGAPTVDSYQVAFGMLVGATLCGLLVALFIPRGIRFAQVSH
ncbi:MFS transporter [Micromonospora radicis]|uniref:MFS transporter n=1 Tax=Micromonospora radicis TaxID=1894971 RepID=A0A418MPW4_9ACTN|nr:MFS transporter [Micromonospora radicis]RIV34578.1 MFS transporter [Micromonospora radicis]